ncbi:MAG: hypothetical protein KatS3mg044_1436 [Rhodothermaceae bacterium]|nr:MAG: hypothetical protein KatS3mg044_1436 [Rhodothermaceae bacterium]
MSPITILEFAPAADEIWGLEHDPHAGYAARDPDAGTLTFHDIPRHDTKMRPLLRGLYAGGKATNVARVLDRLLDAVDDSAPTVSLTTFLARSGPGYDDLTPGAAFVRALQRQEMRRITLAYEPLPPRDGLVADRRCIHLVDERTGTDLLNFSPRLVWSDAEARHVLRALRRHPPEGLVVLAGSVPLGVPGLYPDVIRTLRTVAPTTRIAADIDVPSLIRCLEAGLAPDYVSMNRREFEQIDPSRWEGFRGILHVHDRSGAWVWQAVPPHGPPVGTHRYRTARRCPRPRHRPHPRRGRRGPRRLPPRPDHRVRPRRRPPARPGRRRRHRAPRRRHPGVRPGARPAGRDHPECMSSP